MDENRYADILHATRPVHDGDDFSRRHPKMPLEERAKIFMPFAALKGYGDVVAQERVMYDREQQVSEDLMQEINGTLQELSNRLAEGIPTKVHVRWFVSEKHGEGHNPLTEGEGHYQQTMGELKRIDTQGLRIQVDDVRIPFHALRELRLEEGQDG